MYVCMGAHIYIIYRYTCGHGCPAAWEYRCTGIWVYPKPKPQTLILSVTPTLNLTLTLIDPVIDVTQATTDDGATPLFIACQQGHVDVVLALLEKARGTILVNQVQWCHTTCATLTLAKPIRTLPSLVHGGMDAW